MPDDQNWVDDDDLLPDWMRDLEPEQSPESSDMTDVPEEPSPVTWSAPWQQFADDVPAPPLPVPPTVPPWDVYADDAPPPPSTIQASAPWDVAGDASALLAGLEPGRDQPEAPSRRDEAPGAPDPGLDWFAPEEPSGAPGEPEGDRPWQQGTPADTPAPPPADWSSRPETPHTMADFAAELEQFATDTPTPDAQPSLRDRMASLSPPESPAQPPPGEAGESEWLSAFGEAADYGRAAPPVDEIGLDWLQDEKPPEQPPAPTPAQPVALDDLFEEAGIPAPTAAPETADAVDLEDLFADLGGGEPGEGESLPDWLAGDADELPATGDEAPQAGTPESELPEPGEIRRISGEAEPVSTGDADSVPAWLNAGDVPEESTPQGELSYEEWEALQREQEAEARKTPEDHLLEEVPDWFKTLDAESQPPSPEDASASEKAEFVPGWFLGLEDEPEAEKPDWFRGLDLTTGPLEEPAELSEAPASPPEPEDLDIPDWFKPGPELAGINWAEVGMSPSGANANPDEPPPPAAADGDDAEPEPDWLAGGIPGDEDVIPSPEEIPFPDLGLDQPVPGEAPAGQPAADAGDVGDFIERFDPMEPDALVPETPPGEDMPEWLRDLAVSAAAEPDEPADLFGDVADAGALPELVAAAESEEALDWLESLSPEDLQPEPEELFDLPPVPEVEAAGEESTPEALPDATLDSAALDALLGIDEGTEPIPSERALEAPETALAPVGGEEGDESLQDLEALFDVVEIPGDVPDLEKLFDQAELDQLLDDETPAAEPARPRPPAPVSPFPESDEQAAGPAPDEMPVAGEPQPEWVEELRPTDLPVTLKAGGAEAHVKQKQLTELPDRLRAFREEAMRELGHAEREAEPERGPLADIADALPVVEGVVPEDVGRRTIDHLIITPEQERRVQRLQALLDAGATPDEEDAGEEMSFDEAARLALEGFAPEEAPSPAGKRARRRRRFKPDRLLVMVVMLVALLAPFATDALHLADDPPALAGDRAAVAAQVDALDAGDYVLFAFEYGPVSAGELDGLAEAVLRDVLARGAIPLTISTDPAGAFHAGAVVAALGDDALLLAARDQDEDALVRGEDYVTLSYLPGEAVGVRALRSVRDDGADGYQRHLAFASDVRGDNTGLPVENVATDIALIVVIGDDSNAVRMWAEQLSGLDVPKVALVTAAVEPLVVPYVNEQAYAGYLAGVRDTVAYNAGRNAATRTPYRMPDDLPVDLPDPEESRWHSMALGAAVASGVIVLGMVINVLRALGRRRRR